MENEDIHIVVRIIPVKPHLEVFGCDLYAHIYAVRTEGMKTRLPDLGAVV